MAQNRTWDGLGTCAVDGKVTYISRKVARKFIKHWLPGEQLNAYRCSVNPQHWHVGHLPRDVIEGRMGREALNRQARKAKDKGGS